MIVAKQLGITKQLLPWLALVLSTLVAASASSAEDEGTKADEPPPLRLDTKPESASPAAIGRQVGLPARPWPSSSGRWASYAWEVTKRVTGLLGLDEKKTDSSHGDYRDMGQSRRSPD